MKTVFWKKYLHAQKLLNTPKRMCIPMNFRTFAAVFPVLWKFLSLDITITSVFCGRWCPPS